MKKPVSVFAETVQLTKKYHAGLHILHITTERIAICLTICYLAKEKKITEVCVHHLRYQ